MFKLVPIFALVFVTVAAKSTRNIPVNTYLLFTRESGQNWVEVKPDVASIEDAVSPTLKTVFLIHGHGGTGHTSLNPVVRSAILSSEPTNVIVVDWSRYAAGSYSSAVSSVGVVAEDLASFITLFRSIDDFASDIHLVGFNLGAHVAGIASRSLPTRVPRITGLDPSGRQWGIGSGRLSPGDANYVEVIHTDGSGLLANGIGQAIGQADFFVNGGSNQPGCITHTCCHERAYEVFAATFVNPTLEGRQCASNLQLSLNRCSGVRLRMGANDTGKTGNGIFRANTGRSFPF